MSAANGASSATPPLSPSAASAPSRPPSASKAVTPGAPTSVHVVDPQGNRDTRNSKGPAFPVPENYSIAYEVAGPDDSHSFVCCGPNARLRIS